MIANIQVFHAVFIGIMWYDGMHTVKFRICVLRSKARNTSDSVHKV